MQYKVLVEFELEGEVKAVDSVFELTEEVAAPLVEEGKLKLVEDQEFDDQLNSDDSVA